MAFDEGLAQRIREFLVEEDLEEKKMFGGLCFLVGRHMCCGIVGERLMARVGPENYTTSLKQPFANEMDFTGKAIKGMVYVDPEGLSEDEDLHEWLQICLIFVHSLEPKSTKKQKKTKQQKKLS